MFWLIKKTHPLLLKLHRTWPNERNFCNQIFPRWCDYRNCYHLTGILSIISNESMFFSSDRQIVSHKCTESVSHASQSIYTTKKIGRRYEQNFSVCSQTIFCIIIQTQTQITSAHPALYFFLFGKWNLWKFCATFDSKAKKLSFRFSMASFRFSHMSTPIDEC